MEIELQSESETELFGAKLWEALPSKCLIFLEGELGAGKTTLVRGLLRRAGHKGNVKSPTYTIVEEYTINAQKIYHFDLYRIADPEELEMIGMQDYLAQDCICLIEWAELGQGFLPEADIVLKLQHKSQIRVLNLSKSSNKSINFKTLYWKNKDLLL